MMMQSSDSNIHLELRFSDIPISWKTSFLAIPLPENLPGLIIPMTFQIGVTKSYASSLTFNPHGTLIPELLTLDELNLVSLNLLIFIVVPSKSMACDLKQECPQNQ